MVTLIGGSVVGELVVAFVGESVLGGMTVAGDSGDDTSVENLSYSGEKIALQLVLTNDKPECMEPSWKCWTIIGYRKPTDKVSPSFLIDIVSSTLYCDNASEHPSSAAL